MTRAKHRKPSPWRWLATFPPAAGLVVTCILASWPAVASAAPLRPTGLQSAPTPTLAKDAQVTFTTILARREHAKDRRQEARLDEAQRDEAAWDAIQAAAAARAAEAQQDQQARRAAVSPAPASVPAASAPTPAGIYSYAQLEALWVSAGGPAVVEATAARVAECESGGNTSAYNPSGASGLWQILGQVVAGNIFDPMVNALNAVAKYNAGGWSPWSASQSCWGG